MRDSDTSKRDNDVTEASGSSVIGVVTIAIVSLFFTGIVLLDAPALVEAYRLLRHNIQSASIHPVTDSTEFENQTEAQTIDDVIAQRPSYYRNRLA